LERPPLPEGRELDETRRYLLAQTSKQKRDVRLARVSEKKGETGKPRDIGTKY